VISLFSVIGKSSICVAGIRIVFPMVKVEVDKPGFALIMAVAGTAYRMESAYKVSLGCSSYLIHVTLSFNFKTFWIYTHFP
jgi:hypothetical protein